MTTVRHVYIVALWQTSLPAHAHVCMMMAVCRRHMVHQRVSAGAQHWTGGPHLWNLPARLGCLATIHPAPCLQRKLAACPSFVPPPALLATLNYLFEPFLLICCSELTTSLFLDTPFWGSSISADCLPLCDTSPFCATCYPELTTSL